MRFTPKLRRAALPVLLLAVLAAACLMGGTAGSSAYTTAALRTHNVITAGNIQIALRDQQERDGQLVDWPAGQGIAGAMPGQSVSKVVFVTNTGKSDAWVRLRLTMTLNGAAEPSPGEYLHKDAAGTLQPGYNDKDWLYDAAGGYYLCREPLAPGASSPALIEGVRLNGETLGSDQAGAAVHVTAAAQGVQARNNGASVGQATGWPAA